MPLPRWMPRYHQRQWPCRRHASSKHHPCSKLRHLEHCRCPDWTRDSLTHRQGLQTQSRGESSARFAVAARGAGALLLGIAWFDADLSQTDGQLESSCALKSRGPPETSQFPSNSTISPEFESKSAQSEARSKSLPTLYDTLSRLPSGRPRERRGEESS